MDLNLVLLANTLPTKLSTSTSWIESRETPDYSDYFAGRADWDFLASGRSDTDSVFCLTIFLLKKDAFLTNRCAKSTVCIVGWTDLNGCSIFLFGDRFFTPNPGPKDSLGVVSLICVFDASPSNSMTDLSCSLSNS